TAARDRPSLAGRVGARDPVHGLPRRSAQGRLHKKRHRSPEPATTQSDQDQGPLPHRRRRPETDLPRDPERRAAMDPNPRVDESAAGVQNQLRSPPARPPTTPAYTVRRTPSSVVAV